MNIRQKAITLFSIGLLVRIALLPTGEAGVAHHFFIPFLQRASENIFVNPWALSGVSAEFPYGVALYAALVPAFKIFYFITNTAAEGVLALVLLKLPLLLFDLVLFQNLKLMFSGERIRLLALYWLNPVVIYISFVHNQLDIIPISFLLVGLRLLIRERFWAASICFAFALASKFHVVIVYPLIAAWVWNNYLPKSALRKLFSLCLIVSVGLAAGYALPTIAGHGVYNTLGSPEAQRVFSAAFRLSQDTSLYMGMFFVLLVVGRICFSDRITRDGLFIGCAVIMSALLLAINPMPGWFLWNYPLITLFFVRFPYAPVIVFIAHWMLFFVHFLAFPLLINTTWSQLLSPSLSLTLLQTVSATLLLLVWIFSSRVHFPLGIRLRPLAIGIAGDSGSGKNRLTEAILKLFNQREFLHIEGDDYHKWERNHSGWGFYTHLHPKANHLPSMALNTAALLGGKAIFQPHYDHSTGKFSKPIRQDPKKILVVQGLHTFFLRGMRKEFDLRIFLAPHYLIRLGWKIDRDVSQRGHKLEKVLASMRKRENDSQRYVLAQAIYADCSIEYFPLQEVTENQVIEGRRVPFGVKYTCWNDVMSHIEPLAELLKAEGLEVDLSLSETDFERVTLTVKTFPVNHQFKDIGERLFPNPRTVTRTKAPPMWCAGVDGLHQLVILAILSSQQGQNA